MTHQTVGEHWDDDLVPTEEGRTRAPEPHCPVEIALRAISGRWTTLIMRDSMPADSRSWSELCTALPGLSDNVLGERLANLADRRLVIREVITEFRSRTRYRLTVRGRALRPLLIELYSTGQRLAPWFCQEPGCCTSLGRVLGGWDRRCARHAADLGSREATGVPRCGRSWPGNDVSTRSRSSERSGPARGQCRCMIPPGRSR